MFSIFVERKQLLEMKKEVERISEEKEMVDMLLKKRELQVN